MATPAHPHAMAPRTAGATRTAAPMRAGSWPGSSRIRTYLLFGATGFLYLLVAFVALRLVWALGEGPERWAAVLANLQHPLYVAFHALCLLAVIFVGVRFFRLFPKAQPARIGPVKPPPAPVLMAGLFGAWISVTALFAAVLSGVLF